MVKIVSKGTTLKQEIGTVLTAVAQVISIDLPDMESETYDADTLDNTDAGILKAPTGRSEPGSASAELFYDPALQGHKDVLTLLTVPVEENWSITFADAGASVWTFAGAGVSFGGTVAMNDGLKATVGIALADLPTFPA